MCCKMRRRYQNGRDGSDAYIGDGLLPNDCTCRVAAIDSQRGRFVMAEKSITTQTGPKNGRIDLLVADGEFHKLELLFLLTHCLLSRQFSIPGRLFNDPKHRLERENEKPLSRFKRDLRWEVRRKRRAWSTRDEKCRILPLHGGGLPGAVEEAHFEVHRHRLAK